MYLREWLSWYQKHIGEYDKEQWEQTVEQRILNGLHHVPKKTTKLKPELIDLDLVRGSSFPKIKPKHGILAVAQVALFRLIFLPAYWKFWVQQTSWRTFSLLVALYFLQIINMGLYSHLEHAEDENSENIPLTEVLVPVVMMITLSITHSQIVATHPTVPKITELRHTRHHRTHYKRVSGKTRRVVRSARSRHSVNTSGSDSKPVVDSDTKISTTKKLSSRSLSLEVRSSSPKIETRHRASSEQFSSISPRKTLEHATPTNPTPTGSPLPEEKLADILINPSEPVQVDPVPQLPHKQLRVVLPPDGHEADNDDGFESLAGFSENSDDLTPVRDARAPPLFHENLDIHQEECSDNDTFNATEESVKVRHYSKGSEGRSSAGEAELDTDHLPSDEDNIVPRNKVRSRGCLNSTRKRRFPSQSVHFPESSYNSSCESEQELMSSNNSPVSKLSSATVDWTGLTTNSEECSYSSDESQETDNPQLTEVDHPFAYDLQGSQANATSSPVSNISDKVSCTIWENGDVKKADLTALDISSSIIAKVDSMPENFDYLVGGICISAVLSLIPSLWRFANSDESSISLDLKDMTMPQSAVVAAFLAATTNIMLGETLLERSVVLLSITERFCLACLIFFLLSVAERTFKQRFLYSKLFSHLTSSRRARKSDIPHFRLNKVRNIKTWLSVRSYLKKRGPQRSVDVIVSAAFILTLLLVFFLSIELLKDSERLQYLYNIEITCWSLAVGVFLLRFMTLGTKINAKYRNLSVLITEQINLYLHMEQKPHKKEELMVANSVLKLAADLLKELENPFKISGFAANPYLYNITKLVILSAFSGVLSEMLGFKLKLYKIKIK